jgi:hypothetical protein
VAIYEMSSGIARPVVLPHKPASSVQDTDLPGGITARKAGSRINGQEFSDSLILNNKSVAE